MDLKEKPRREPRQAVQTQVKSNTILGKTGKIQKLYYFEFDQFLNDLPTGTRPENVISVFDEIFNLKHLGRTKTGRLKWVL